MTKGILLASLGSVIGGGMLASLLITVGVQQVKPPVHQSTASVVVYGSNA